LIKKIRWRQLAGISLIGLTTAALYFEEIASWR